MRFVAWEGSNGAQRLPGDGSERSHGAERLRGVSTGTSAAVQRRPGAEREAFAAGPETLSAGYEYEYSLDGGVTWLPFPQPFTTKASATMRGQKPGSTVHFRTLKGVTHDWSDPVAIIVD